MKRLHQKLKKSRQRISFKRIDKLLDRCIYTDEDGVNVLRLPF